MEAGFYVILLLLVFLKMMIWVCVFYSRARRRQIIAQRGLIIVEGDITAGHTRDRDIIITREHLPGMSQVGLDNPTIVTNPPSYEEVQRSKCNEEKPPSYDQIVAGETYLPTTSSNGNERPPEYSPVATQLQQTTPNTQQTTTDSQHTATSNSHA